MIFWGRRPATAAAKAAATKAATAATTATTAIVFAGTRFVDVERSALEVFAIHAIDGGLGFRSGQHLHEAEASGFTREFILKHRSRFNLAECRESLPQIIIGNFPRYVTYIDLHIVPLILIQAW